MAGSSSSQSEAWRTRRRNQRTEDWVRRELVKPEYERGGYNVKVETNEWAWVKAYATQGVTDAQKALDKLGFPTVPPADLACSRAGTSLGVEIKFFKESAKKKYRFYEGIDEVAALLLQPYDKVVLWHVFDESFETATVERDVARHIERLLKGTVPIGYECRQIASEKLRTVLHVEAPDNPFKHSN